MSEKALVVQARGGQKEGMHDLIIDVRRLAVLRRAPSQIIRRCLCTRIWLTLVPAPGQRGSKFYTKRMQQLWCGQGVDGCQEVFLHRLKAQSLRHGKIAFAPTPALPPRALHAPLPRQPQTLSTDNGRDTLIYAPDNPSQAAWAAWLLLDCTKPPLCLLAPTHIFHFHARPPPGGLSSRPTTSTPPPSPHGLSSGVNPMPPEPYRGQLRTRHLSHLSFTPPSRRYTYRDPISPPHHDDHMHRSLLCAPRRPHSLSFRPLPAGIVLVQRPSRRRVSRGASPGRHAPPASREQAHVDRFLYCSHHRRHPPGQGPDAGQRSGRTGGD